MKRSEIRQKVTAEVLRVLGSGPLTATDIIDSMDLPDGADRQTVHSVVWYLKSQDRIGYSMASKQYRLKEPGAPTAGSRVGAPAPQPPAPPRDEGPRPPSKLTGHGTAASSPAAPRGTPPPAAVEDDEQPPEPAAQTTNGAATRDPDPPQEDSRPPAGTAQERDDMPETPAPPTPTRLDIDIPRFLDGMDVDPEVRRQRMRQARATLLIQASDLTIRASDLRIQAAQILDDGGQQ